MARACVRACVCVCVCVQKKTPEGAGARCTRCNAKCECSCCAEHREPLPCRAAAAAAADTSGCSFPGAACPLGVRSPPGDDLLRRGPLDYGDATASPSGAAAETSSPEEDRSHPPSVSIVGAATPVGRVTSNFGDCGNQVYSVPSNFCRLQFFTSQCDELTVHPGTGTYLRLLRTISENSFIWRRKR